MGGFMMKQKLTRPCVITTVDFNAQSAFKGIGKNALILIDILIIFVFG